MIRPVAIGWKAHAALRVTGGTARVLAPLTTSTYLDANGQVVWLGGIDSVRHPRAIQARGEFVADSGTVIFDLAGLDPWPPRGCADATVSRDVSRALLARLRQPPADVPAPLGLGRLLVGASPDFPLDRAVGAVTAMAFACDHDDAARAVAAAEALLGLGPGLTPSGDDIVGGVLFARRAAVVRDAEWGRAAADIVTRARSRTHPISAALLEDLAAGAGHEPVHDLVDALARGHLDQAWSALQRLSRLGHSSGWDLATGVLIGLAGTAALAPP